MSKLTIKTDLKINHVPNEYITHFDGTKVFDSIEDAVELNYYDVKGALLSYNSSTNKYTAWNGEENLDSRTWDYRADRRDYASNLSDSDGNLFAGTWDEDVVFPDTYGDVIAVCVGNGLWMSTKWDPTNSGPYYQWCSQDSPLYETQLDCILGMGWDNTSKLVGRCQEGDLFAYVRDFGADDGTQGHWYVPSKFEYHAICNLGEIFENPDPEYEYVSCHFLNNISNAVYMTDGYYWTSSQFPYLGSSDSSYIIDNANYVSTVTKTSYCKSTVLLRFGDALYQPQNQ